MFAQPIVPTVPVGLPSELLTRRPDLLQAEQQMVYANALVGAAKGEFFPKLSLTGLLGSASPEVSAMTSGTASCGPCRRTDDPDLSEDLGAVPRPHRGVGAGEAQYQQRCCDRLPGGIERPLGLAKLRAERVGASVSGPRRQSAAMDRYL
jgi:hypothetical protein